MPPDGYTAICQCELCEGKDTPERGYRGVLSDYVWDFVNRVAREVRKTHPDKMISNCAYGTYTLPPQNIDKLEPNVQVIIVGGRRPTNDRPEEREEIRKLLLGLRLKGMEQHLDTILDQAEQTGQAPAEVVVETTAGRVFRSGRVEARWEPPDSLPTDGELEVDQNLDNTLGWAIGIAHQATPSQGERFNSWGYPTVDDALIIGGGVLLGGVITVLYTLVGGFRAGFIQDI